MQQHFYHKSSNEMKGQHIIGPQYLQIPVYLDTLQNLLLELPLDLMALIISRRLPMEVQQSAKVELR